MHPQVAGAVVASGRRTCNSFLGGFSPVNERGLPFRSHCAGVQHRSCRLCINPSAVGGGSRSQLWATSSYACAFDKVSRQQRCQSKGRCKAVASLSSASALARSEERASFTIRDLSSGVQPSKAGLTTRSRMSRPEAFSASPLTTPATACPSVTSACQR